MRFRASNWMYMPAPDVVVIYSPQSSAGMNENKCQSTRMFVTINLQETPMRETNFTFQNKDFSMKINFFYEIQFRKERKERVQKLFYVQSCLNAR
jgi:hypothetical protein